MIHVGQGVLYAEACADLLELAELIEAPVMTTMEAKGAFPEDHPLALGTGGPAVAGPLLHFLREADLVLGTVVLNNSSMAIEIPHLVVSHDKYRTRDIGGRYADLARAMGGWSERVERPEDVAGAFGRARKATENGQAALLEFITSEETRFSHRGALR